MKIPYLLCFALTLSATVSFGHEGSPVSRKKAVRIAKKDKESDLRTVEEVSYVVDSVTQKAYWVVLEKVDLKKEAKRLLADQNHYGMTYIYADQLKIDAASGAIIERKQLNKGSFHTSPAF